MIISATFSNLILLAVPWVYHDLAKLKLDCVVWNQDQIDLLVLGNQQPNRMKQPASSFTRLSDLRDPS